MPVDYSKRAAGVCRCVRRLGAAASRGDGRENSRRRTAAAPRRRCGDAAATPRPRPVSRTPTKTRVRRRFDNIIDSDEDKPKEAAKTTKKAAVSPKCQKCANCGLPAADGKSCLKKCTICRKVAYCSQRCQRDDWRFHKRVCAKPKKDENKKDDRPTPPKEKKAKAKKNASTAADDSDDDDDDDDGPITWYKHRETKLPDSNVVRAAAPTSSRLV